MYPGTAKSKEEQFAWSKGAIKAALSELNSQLFQMENSPYETLTNDVYTATFVLVDKENGLSTSNISMFLGNLIVFDAA